MKRNRTYLAVNPNNGDPNVIIEVHPDLPDGADEVAHLEPLKRRLYHERLPAGLLVSPKFVYVVRDTFKSLNFDPKDSYKVDRIITKVFFSQIYDGRTPIEQILYSQTKRWLEMMSQSWSTAVPDEAVPFVLPELVGGLADTEIVEVDGLLNIEDAAE